MDAEQVGQDVERRHPDDQRRHIQEVERQVADQGVARHVAAAEDPQLGQEEVVQRRHLRGEDSRDQVVDPEPVRQQVQDDLVDDDPDDADERELRGAEQRPKETSGVRPAMTARLLRNSLLRRDDGPLVRAAGRGSW